MTKASNAFDLAVEQQDANVSLTKARTTLLNTVSLFLFVGTVFGVVKFW